MKSRKIWANYSVNDAQRTSHFYTKLGFTPNTPSKYPKLASFLFGDDNFVIHFFEKGSQIDEYLSTGNTDEIMFTLSAETKEEIQEWTEKVESAGGKVLKQPGRDKTNHYGFVFADPDGHKFNVLLMEAGM